MPSPRAELPPRTWIATVGLAALLLAAALLVATAAAVSLSLGELQRSRTAVLRSNDILQSAELLQRDVRTAETGQRGFLLTGDARYLAPYAQARSRIPDDLQRLDALIADPAQRRRWAAVPPLVQLKLEELATTIRLAAASRERALEVVVTGRGQSYMEQIDQTMSVFVAGERDLLRARMAREQQVARQTAYGAAATALLALVSALSGAVMVLRERNIRSLRAANASLETRIAARTADLTRANHELDAFAYTISHDLRAPLRGMRGYSEAIEEDFGAQLPPEGLDYLRRIGRVADRMNRLIEDILAFAKLAREDLSVRPTPLSRAVDGARESLGEDCRAADLHISPNLGEVLANPAALQQVLANLLSNACKYVEAGSAPHVEVWSEERGDRVRLWVQDRGIGVSPEHRERIFQPFERLHGVETYAGTGIGLAIVRRACERMGGASGVDANPDGGSRFWIELRKPGAPM